MRYKIFVFFLAASAQKLEGLQTEGKGDAQRVVQEE